MPRIKLESTDIEVSINTDYLKSRSDMDNDDLKAIA